MNHLCTVAHRPMIFLLPSLMLFLILFQLTAPALASAQNPFTAPSKSQETSPHQHPLPAPVVKSKFFVRLVVWQQQLRQKMATEIREVKTGRKAAPLMFLALSAFLYGVLHSAGPGHGKAVALSYILSCKPSVARGVLFGNILALTHGGSGIFLVLGANFIFNTAISASLETMTRYTQMISFSLITALGLGILAKALWQWWKPRQPDIPSRLYSAPMATAFTVGMIPCPGVVMVMIFSISMGMTWLGILLGGIVALGMAFTITLVVLAGMSGKAALMAAASRKRGILGQAEHILEAASGILVAGLGALLLAAAM